MSQALAPSRVSSPAASTSPVWRYVAIAAGILLLFGIYYLATRPGAEQLPVVYGQRRGYKAVDSVNGTSVLAKMFTKAGHEVRSITRLSPKTEDFQTIVWFPDDFKPPTAEQRDYLETWLLLGEGRTLIYIGRDYDAAVDYWTDIQPIVPADQADEVKRRLDKAEEDFKSARKGMPKDAKSDWFTVKARDDVRKAKSLSGPWADGVDASKVDIQVQGTLDPPQPADPNSDKLEGFATVETLLASDQDTLVTRITDPMLGDGQIIVVTNGSFLLNYPLVNHEHRKLAARLVSQVGPGEVAFLESQEDGPEILDEEPESTIPSGLELIKIWPLNVILFHLTLLGIVFCIARWPIFGRPRDLPAESNADFGKHVTALGELLHKTKDTAYAQARLHQYQTQGKRESGKSHR